MTRFSHPSQSPQFQRANWRIEQLPGLSVEDQQKLLDCGITTTQLLLKKTRSSTQKQILSSELQIHIQHIHKWAALAELAQVPAVGCDYCGLLLHAGICSCSQLADTSIAQLHKQVLRFYVANLQRQDLCPTRGQMARWIEQAQVLNRVEQLRLSTSQPKQLAQKTATQKAGTQKPIAKAVKPPR